MNDDRFGNERLLKKLEGTNEPYFVLRAQDVFSAYLVNLWADIVESAGCPHDKIVNARQCSRAMKNWLNKKVPD